MSDVKKLTSENFDEFVRGESKVVVDFWAEWCGPCQMFIPIFEKVASEMKDKAKFGKVDVDDAPELAQRFQIMSVPTILFFKDGQQVDRINGGMSEKEFSQKVKEI